MHGLYFRIRMWIARAQNQHARQYHGRGSQPDIEAIVEQRLNAVRQSMDFLPTAAEARDLIDRGEVVAISDHEMEVLLMFSNDSRAATNYWQQINFGLEQLDRKPISNKVLNRTCQHLVDLGILEPNPIFESDSAVSKYYLAITQEHLGRLLKYNHYRLKPLLDDIRAHQAIHHHA